MEKVTKLLEIENNWKTVETMDKKQLTEVCQVYLDNYANGTITADEASKGIAKLLDYHSYVGK